MLGGGMLRGGMQARGMAGCETLSASLPWQPREAAGGCGGCAGRRGHRTPHEQVCGWGGCGAVLTPLRMDRWGAAVTLSPPTAVPGARGTQSPAGGGDVGS